MNQARKQSRCNDGVSLRVVPAGASWRAPGGSTASLCVVLRGGCTLGAGSGVLEVNESYAALVSPWQVMEHRAASAGAVVAMVDLGAWKGPARSTFVRLEDSHSYYLISKLLVAHLDGAWRRSAATVRTLSGHLWRLSMANDDIDGCIASIVRIIHDDPLSPPSLEQLADIARVHPMTLARRFRAHRGCSIGDFRQRVRAERAFYRVIKTPATLSELSLVCGFSDQSHMTRQFRRFFGTTPALLRRATLFDQDLHALRRGPNQKSAANNAGFAFSSAV